MHKKNTYSRIPLGCPNLDNLYKGDFYVPEEHHGCRVFINPQNKLLIKIKVKGKIYYLGGYNDKETKQIYELRLAQCESIIKE